MPPVTEPSAPTFPSTHPADALAFVRVEYPTGPDRCTIYPHSAEGLTLMETWLTADGDAFVDLGAMR